MGQEGKELIQRASKAGTHRSALLRSGGRDPLDLTDVQHPYTPTQAGDIRRKQPQLAHFYRAILTGAIEDLFYPTPWTEQNRENVAGAMDWFEEPNLGNEQHHFTLTFVCDALQALSGVAPHPDAVRAHVAPRIRWIRQYHTNTNKPALVPVLDRADPEWESEISDSGPR